MMVLVASTPTVLVRSPSRSPATKARSSFTFAEGTAIADVANAINSFTDALGVTATSAAAGDDVQIDSTGYGTDQFVRVRQLSDNGGFELRLQRRQWRRSQ